MELSPSQVYLGNARLKKAGVKIDYTEEQIQELVKCSQDIDYFCKHYMKIVSVDEGVIPLELYDFQKDIILFLPHRKILEFWNLGFEK